MSGSESAIPAGVGIEKASSPSTTVALTEAELAAEAMANPADSDLARAARVLPAAVAAVEQYAPGAPDVLRREATIRFGAYLLGSDYGAVTAEEIGPKKIAYPVNHADAFRRSGAAMLLSRWRVRRAGKIG